VPNKNTHWRKPEKCIESKPKMYENRDNAERCPVTTYLAYNSDENEFSLFIITTYSNIQVMRIKELITKNERS